MTPVMPAAPDFPPDHFNVTAFVFRPSFSYVPRPGLGAEIETLTNRRRYRSALEVLLRILDGAPQDQEALTLAMILFSKSRTENVQADEALSPREYRDTRLDPLFAVCSHCKTVSWVPHNCLFADGFAGVTVNNPVGLQCWGCGYVICRKCFGGVKACPNCAETDLRTTVYPTGRHPRQLQRRSRPLAGTLVFREGPIPPDAGWINEFLELVSPDAWEHDARISAYPVSPWRDDIAEMAMAVAAMRITDGALGTAATLQGAIGQEVRSAEGLKVYVLKVYVGE